MNAASIDNLLLKSALINFCTPGIDIAFLSIAYTSAPSSNNYLTVAYPIPEAAPVTTHTLSL